MSETAALPRCSSCERLVISRDGQAMFKVIHEHAERVYSFTCKNCWEVDHAAHCQCDGGCGQ